MKNLGAMFENLWVAIAFAEAGVSETALMHNAETRIPDSVIVPAA